MHWSIIRTLLEKELLRLAGNRGALVTAALLMTCGLVMAAFEADVPHLTGTGGVNVFWVDYWRESAWIDHLRATVPQAWSDRVRFRNVTDIPTDRNGILQYGRSEGALQLRPISEEPSDSRAKVWFWYAGDNPAVLAPYEQWFWQETYRYCRYQMVAALPADRGRDVAALVPEVEVEHSSLHGLEPRRTMATGLTLFSLYFACALLLPSLTCEERERGTLRAQALSPASAIDMLVAKAIVYPGLGIILAAAVAIVARPMVGLTPSFWLVLATVAIGTFGLGVVIASLARTQRAASTGALAYALVVATVTVVGQRCGIPALSSIFPESQYPSLFYTVFNDTDASHRWQSLGSTLFLSLLWVGLGVVLFRRRGLS